jgi:hypothetical protein
MISPLMKIVLPSSKPKQAAEQIDNGSKVATLTLGSLILPDRSSSEGILVRSYADLAGGRHDARQ